MSVLGIDFGNLNCVVSICQKGSVDTVVNSLSKRSTPAVMTIDGEQRFLGEMAGSKYKMHFKNSVIEPKRLLGRSWNEPELQDELKMMWCKSESSADGARAMLQLHYGEEMIALSPEEVVGCLLGHLKEISENFSGISNIHDCVITVPPYFTQMQRQAMLDAAKLGRLNVLRLMNETTAVALQYGLLRKLPVAPEPPIHVMFVDVGHSSTNVAVVEFMQGKLKVLSTASDRFLGGRDFDRLILAHFIEHVKTTKRLNPEGNAKAMMRLLDAAERTKVVLSANSETSWGVECLMEDTDVSGSLTREQFETMAQPLLERLEVPIKEALQISKIALDKLHSVEVIGGSVRIPSVRNIIEKITGLPISMTCDGDESVSRGAALQAAMISPNFKVRDCEVIDVSPYALEFLYGPQGEEPKDAQTLFQAFSPMPKSMCASFYLPSPYQITVRYSDPSKLPAGSNNIVCNLVVSGVPKAVDGDKPPRSKVNVKLNENGMLTIMSANAIVYCDEEETSAASPASAKKSEATEASAAAMDTTPTEEEKADKPADGADAMDTSGADADAKKKTRKAKKTTLAVDIKMVGGLSPEAIQTASELQASMALRDRVIAETAAKRNDLESYIYEMRDKLELELQEFISEEARNKYMEDLTNTEDWLYSAQGESAQKSDFAKRLEELQSVGEPVLKRQYEAMHREQHVTHLKTAISRFQQWAHSNDEAYAHIAHDKKEQVLQSCQSADEWLCTALTQQGKLSPSDDPVLTVQELEHKLHELRQIVEPIQNTPKPKPKPAPETKKEKEPAPADAEGAAMDTEPEESEANAQPETKASDDEARREEPMEATAE